MAKPKDLNLDYWNTVADAFHAESDRGAAVLAGSFVENMFGVFLRGLVVDTRVGSKLFDAMGPLATFSQRASVARAFGFITEEGFQEAELIRKTRNHFAHHPLDANFGQEEVGVHCRQMLGYEWATQTDEPGSRNRAAYLLSCAVLCGMLDSMLKKHVREAAQKRPSPLACMQPFSPPEL